MTDEYPRVERRQDHKIDDIWESLPQVRTDITDIKSDITAVRRTVSQHDAALFGYQDEHGRHYDGLVSLVQRIPKFFRWVLGFLTVIITGLVINFLSHYYGWVK